MIYNICCGQYHIVPMISIKSQVEIHLKSYQDQHLSETPHQPPPRNSAEKRASPPPPNSASCATSSAGNAPNGPRGRPQLRSVETMGKSWGNHARNDGK